MVNLRNMVGPLLATRQRREVLLALTAGYMLIQLSSLPVALAVPSLADYFDAGIDEAAWIVIAYLLGLGSFVLLGARLGDRYGHSRVFFVGILASTAGAVLIALSNDLWQIVVWRALTGAGAALVMGNANAILAATFPPDERGRAFSIPIMGSRFGTLMGLIIFGVLLQFLSWRLVFVAFLPLGIIALAASIPMLRQREHSRPTNMAPVDLIGGVLLIAVAAVLVLSSNHLHGGDDSFTSSDGLRYHLPMQVLFVVMLGVFILVERRVSNPMVELSHFRHKYFSMSLTANVTFHFSMLATMTLVPILVERGFGLAPLWVTVALVPNQILGLIIPFMAGWVYDKYQPKLLRPAAMVGIALGFLGFGLFAGMAPFWAIPIMMIPISIGSAIFNPVNNATVMSALPLEHRGFASGMLETTRELGHALGATASATALAMVLPAGIEVLSRIDARSFFVEGFQFSAMMVVFIMLTGATIAYFHKEVFRSSQTAAAPTAGASHQPGAD